MNTTRKQKTTRIVTAPREVLDSASEVASFVVVAVVAAVVAVVGDVVVARALSTENKPFDTSSVVKYPEHDAIALILY